MSQTEFLGLELCLSRRTDLVNSIVGQVLESRLPGWRQLPLSVVAHVVEAEDIAKLHFLISTHEAAEQQRRKLIVAGERMLQEAFSKSPWETPPLVADSGHKLPARLEIYAKCRIADEHAWFELCGIPRDQVALTRSTTALLRSLRVEHLDLKSVLPLLVLRACPAHTSSLYLSLDGEPSRSTMSGLHWLQRQVSRLRTRGLLANSEIDAAHGYGDSLRRLESYVADTARALNLSPVLIVRSLLKQLGFRALERDYLMMIGHELWHQTTTEHPAT